MLKTKPLTQLQVEVSSHFTSFACNATISIVPGDSIFQSISDAYPPRDQIRNNPIGANLIRLNEHILALGMSYSDLKDNQTDEDIRLIDILNKTITTASPTEIEQKYPCFKGFHKGDKSYFSKPKPRCHWPE